MNDNISKWNYCVLVIFVDDGNLVLIKWVCYLIFFVPLKHKPLFSSLWRSSEWAPSLILSLNIQIDRDSEWTYPSIVNLNILQIFSCEFILDPICPKITFHWQANHWSSILPSPYFLWNYFILFFWGLLSVACFGIFPFELNYWDYLQWPKTIAILS